MILRRLISNRYRDDGIPQRPLSDRQKIEWQKIRSKLQSGSFHEEDVPNCVLCGSSSGYLIAEKDRYANPLPTVVCKGCGLIRSAKRLDESSTGEFYAHHYRTAYDDDSSLEALESRYTNAAIAGTPEWNRRLDRLRLTPTAMRVFEIGAGGGWNLIPFRELGCQVAGCDYGENFVKLGHGKGLNLFCGGVAEYTQKFPEEKFDLVLMIEVLEHTLNPRTALQQCRHLLRDNGLLCIGVPPLTAGHVYWEGDLLETLQNAHNYLFDFKTLCLLLKEEGFDLVLGNRLMDGAFFRKVSLETVPSQKTPLKNRGIRILAYLKIMEFFFRPYWRALRWLLLDRISPQLQNTIKFWHLRILLPDYGADCLAQKWWKLKKKFMS